MLSLGQSCVLCSKQHTVTILIYPGPLLTFPDFKLNLALDYRQILSSFMLISKRSKLIHVRPKLHKCLDEYFLSTVYRSLLVSVQVTYKQQGLEPKTKTMNLSTLFYLIYRVCSFILIKIFLPI